MFAGNPVGTDYQEILLRECASYASYRQRERKFIRKSGNGAASRVNNHVAR